ncbi:Hypothetical_protein [Hexamita inflata]|uniref:Hypothetical_protein n=1 Tax=Hexamita inflata TaxID=28002 RepID=A0AA86QY16_9EUKA|nr:Hypothetical protein HINF_LOCUS55806 [Hexamita inflata]
MPQNKFQKKTGIKQKSHQTRKYVFVLIKYHTLKRGHQNFGSEFQSYVIYRYQLQTATDKELCLFVDQMPLNLKIQLKFWDRVSVLCLQPDTQGQRCYYIYKQQIFTDKLNSEDKVVIYKYMKNNQELTCDQTISAVLKTLIKEKNISFQNISEYVQVLQQYILLQCRQRLSFALKQILKQIGYQVETTSENKYVNLLIKYHFIKKKQLKFWDHVSVLCQQSKQSIQEQYLRYIKHIQTDNLSDDNQDGLIE